MGGRVYKSFASGSIHHIYNRGNNKERIFFDEQDYRAFLFRLGVGLGHKSQDLNKYDATKSPKSRIRISQSPGMFKLHAFCLMPNHFHLLIEQCSETSISSFISRVSISFAMYINKKYKRVGYVFQDRFKSVGIENNSQLMWTASYIHMNPVKASLVVNPYDYKWSSYNDFTENRNIPITSKDLILETFGSKENLIRETFALNKDDLPRGVLDIFDT